MNTASSATDSGIKATPAVTPPTPAAALPMAGTTILELGATAAGQFAGRLLASLGARVIKIEPIGGEAERRGPDMVRDRHGRQRSLAFEYLNAGKQSIAVDLDDGFLAEFILKFSAPDAVILSTPRLAARVPQAFEGVLAKVGPYGEAHNHGDPPTTPLTRYQAGGDGSLIPPGPEPTLRPTFPGTLVGDCFAGAGAAVSILGTLYMKKTDARLKSEPQPAIDFSQQAHLLMIQKLFLGRVWGEKMELTRANNRYAFGGAVKCKDGFVSMLVLEEHQWKGLCTAMGREAWLADPRFATGTTRWENQAVIQAGLEEWCGTRSVVDVLAATRALSVPIGHIATLPEVLQKEYLRERGYLQETDSDLGRIVTLGLPFGRDPMWQGAHAVLAPGAGEHTAAILRGLGRSDADIELLERLGVVQCM